MIDNKRYVVRVGVTGEPTSREYAGDDRVDYVGPMTEADARVFETAVRARWEDLRSDDPDGFVYGEPVVEIIRLTWPRLPFAVQGPSMAALGERAADNWHLEAEQRVPD